MLLSIDFEESYRPRACGQVGMVQGGSKWPKRLSSMCKHMVEDVFLEGNGKNGWKMEGREVERFGAFFSRHNLFFYVYPLLYVSSSSYSCTLVDIVNILVMSIGWQHPWWFLLLLVRPWESMMFILRPESTVFARPICTWIWFSYWRSRRRRMKPQLRHTGAKVA